MMVTLTSTNFMHLACDVLTTLCVVEKLCVVTKHVCKIIHKNYQKIGSRASLAVRGLLAKKVCESVEKKRSSRGKK
jgi:hypothetical protein